MWAQSFYYSFHFTSVIYGLLLGFNLKMFSRLRVSLCLIEFFGVYRSVRHYLPNPCLPGQHIHSLQHYVVHVSGIFHRNWVHFLSILKSLKSIKMLYLYTFLRLIKIQHLMWIYHFHPPGVAYTFNMISSKSSAYLS